MTTEILKLAAFSDGDRGGNLAGVWIGDALPDDLVMQQLAAEVGFSETVFAAPVEGCWRVRYFSPLAEVPFCGHATIALGAALAARQGDGVFNLTLNQAQITVEGHAQGSLTSAALQSPPTFSKPISAQLLEEALALFGYTHNDLDERIKPAHINGGAGHLVLALNSRAQLKAMHYDQQAGRELMVREGWATILLVWAETEQLFHTRNPFAFGGVYEDPATGAATAALGGYLRDTGWPHGGLIDIIQGEDMGSPSRLRAEIPEQPGSSIRVSGMARTL
ncbi:MULTISPECIES: PhzF family phenazine biosynthesis protein [Pseudomonas syringae group genomosp. 2]|uniref:Phenazine biosynthesis protein n=1 Tax=Pseudomonas savastanoi TaxID=29438 RepID=A0A3M5J5F4_PSESS|nr:MULTISPECIES: PhzF family phenazine biosynthesis protein [Pseudomonas syringae group genomosp. 2]KPW59745.1 Phenazine biosynthesis family protein [Pseudomonas syringae pv. broussonetiae]KWS99888.1 PhzF family phenazine biosynthesis protein [Pseudomonas syringae pv. broussonetiae]RMS19017.1 Phenazine biosynthesis protein [Pseudomonas savastanoi]RMT18393.1 Phenazine biosynthesis protein [Pseudomonas savastanoi]